MGDICARPQRKVIFPHIAPVARFVEKTSMRYRLKGTEYVLEIARYDEYCRVNAPGFPGQTPASMSSDISDAPLTSWGASVFDPNWDNLLGEHANLPLGHSAGHDTGLDTFFPSLKPALSKSKNAGFWELISLVKELAAILGSTPNPAVQAPSKADGYKKPRTLAQDELLVPGCQNATLLQTDLGTLF